VPFSVALVTGVGVDVVSGVVGVDVVPAGVELSLEHPANPHSIVLIISILFI
jgi:hypothetical protein